MESEELDQLIEKHQSLCTAGSGPTLQALLQLRTLMDLKAVLMQLGNRLVMEHGFEPSAMGWMQRDARAQTTHPIRQLTQFLNEHPEAREELKTLGLEWPM